MTVFGVGFNTQSTDQYDFNKHLKAIKSLGCQEVRYGLSWRNVEANGWDEVDWAVGKTAKHGLRVLPVIYRTPERLGATNSPPPAGEYADFVEQCARRYNFKHVEVWNEQNWLQDDWAHASSADDPGYCAIYRAAQSRLKSIFPRGHSAIVGGLATPGGTDWLRRNWLKLEPVDAVGWHPYGITVQGTWDMIHQMEKTLADLGHPNVPIDITETGLPVPNFTEQERTQLLRRMAETIKADKHVRRFNVYTWFPEELNFYIANRDGSLKPSAKAYGIGIHS